MVDWRSSRGGEAAALPRVPDGLGVMRQIRSLIAATARPCVLTTEREISVLRRGLTKEGWKRALYLQPAPEHPLIYRGTGLLSIANQQLDREIVVPAPGGDFEDLFCECGEELPALTNAQFAPEYVCPACGSKCSGEKYDAAVRHMQHRALAGATLALALVYAIEKDKAYAHKASEILLKYARAYPSPGGDPADGGIIHQSAWEAAWVIPLAQAYDILYHSRSLTEAENKEVTQQLFRAAADRLRKMGIQGHYGAWHIAAEGVIGFAIKDAELVQRALDSFRAAMTDELGDDGLWPQSPHSRHFFALMAFVHLAEACYRSGIDIYNWQVRPGKSLRAMFATPLLCAYPSLRLPAIGEGPYDSFLPLHLYEVANRRWNDPAFAWVLKKGYKFREAPASDDHRRRSELFSRSSFYAFLFGRDLPGRLAAPSVKGSDLPGHGMCTLRSDDDQMITFLYGPSADQEHRDKLSFTLYANDSLLIPDYGTAAEGRPIREWQMSTPAHNTVVVDHKSQKIAKECRLTRRCSGTFAQFAEAEARGLYPGVTHTRGILALGNACVIYDNLSSAQEHDYDWLVRCEGEPSVIGDHKPAKLNTRGHPLIKVERAWRAPDGCRIDWRCEHGLLALGAWAQGSPMDAALGSCPAETAARRVSLAMLRSHGREARFVTALTWSRSGEIELISEGRTVKIGRAEECDYVYVRDTSGEGPHGPLETDGDLAALRIRDGEIQAIVLLGGSWIKWQGESLLECPAEVQFVEVYVDEHNLAVNYSADTAGMLKIRTRARAMRINGHRVSAATSEGTALLRVTPQMLAEETVNSHL